MRSLQWTPENSVYLPELDEEHQEIFRLTQALRDSVLAGEQQDRLQQQTLQLAEEITRHLRHEERLMREARYPQAEWHKRQHLTIRTQLVKLTEAIGAGEQAAIFDSLEAIARWMRDHTAIADRMAGAYLRNYLRAAAVNEPRP